MAARDATVELPADTWTQITNGETTGDVSICVTEGWPILIQATTSASAPSDTDGMILAEFGHGWSEATIAEKFPGLTSPDHLYGRPLRSGVAAKVYVSHG